jgi:hypothetical protein
MTGYDLPNNYIENPEALQGPLTVEPVTPAPSATPSMAKTLHDYSTLVIANVPIGPAINVGEVNFELRTSLITMVQANQCHGLPSKDANAHLHRDTIIIKVVTLKSIRFYLFPFSLSGKAKQWFYKENEAVKSWDKCSMTFLAKFFPMAKPMP